MPLMRVADWVFLLEQYATEAANTKLVIHPETVLRWIENMREDHPDL
jgi:hypothetical protein